MEYDVVIEAGEPIDPVKHYDGCRNIGIKDGRIAAVTTHSLTGRKVIDARGKAVCPGFVDIHGHVEGDDWCARCSLLQGVTTVVSGNCGFSPSDLSGFFRRFDKEGFPINQAECVGHSGTLRELAGCHDRYQPATPDQIRQMVYLTERAMEEGACGLSLGLGYAPGSSLKEAVALAKVAAKYGRFVPIDTRMYTPTDLYSLTEAFGIGRASGAHVQVSHFVYQYGNGMMEEALEMTDAVRQRGLEVTIDSGMYAHWATGIGSAIFDEALATNGDEMLFDIVACTGEHKGQHLDIRLYRHMREFHKEDSAICFVGLEDEIIPPLLKDYAMPSSDTGAYRPGEGHPQTSGSFARFFRVLAREQGLLSWQEAVKKASWLPARVVGLKGKGSLSRGSDADLVIFDKGLYCDTADYLGYGQPDTPPVGVECVLVNGKVAVEGQRVVDPKAGKLIRF